MLSGNGVKPVRCSYDELHEPLKASPHRTENRRPWENRRRWHESIWCGRSNRPRLRSFQPMCNRPNRAVGPVKATTHRTNCPIRVGKWSRAISSGRIEHRHGRYTPTGQWTVTSLWTLCSARAFMLRGVSGNAPKKFTTVRKIHCENDRMTRQT